MRALAACIVLLGVSAVIVATPAASASSGLFVNDAQITIPSKGKASAYPSAIEVGGMAGRITDMSVRLRGVSHTDPSDVDVLLVSPEGDAAVVMSDACGIGDVTGASWTFTHALGGPMPRSEPCGELFYRPTDHFSGDFFPDAPFGSYPANLDRFVGEGANGTWRLFVIDDATNDSGRIAQGWSLAITTAVPDLVVPAAGGAGQADQYPITRTIPAERRIITDLDVALSGVFHERLTDLDVLLVGPRGEKVMLMSDACGNTAAKNAAWGWDDAASGYMSQSGPCESSRSYTPTNVGPVDQLPSPAPAGQYGYNLSDFDYTDPAGDWKLYVHDDVVFDGNGFFTDRFTLDLETRPPAELFLGNGTLDVAEGETVQLTLPRSSGGRGLGPGSVAMTSAPVSATSGRDFEAVSTTVEFPDGATQTKVPVRALADALPEDTETYRLTFGASAGDIDATAPASVLVRIRDTTPRPVPEPEPVVGAGQDEKPRPVEPRPDPVGDAVDRIAPAIGPVTVRGRTFRFTLSEPAAVTLRVERAKGRRRAAARTVRRLMAAGPGRIRLGGRALRRGTYRVRVEAVDAAGNRAATRTRAFRSG